MKDNKKSIREMLNFQDLSEEEKKRRGILGRLYGPCASITSATRNGRFYSDEVWEKVFNENEIVKEMIANGGIPMELDHPTDREETKSMNIAAMLPAAPKRDENGHLICYIDIIDTPCGKIAYQLAKYGFKLGISSRGTGDLYTDSNGNEAVDPDTYDFTTFDLVLLPAVKDARLSMCEAYDTKTAALKKALTESYNAASTEDKKIMEQVLSDLDIMKLNEDLYEENQDKVIEVTEEDAPESQLDDDIMEKLVEEKEENTEEVSETEEVVEEPSTEDVAAEETTDAEATEEEVSNEEAAEDELVADRLEIDDETEITKSETVGDFVGQFNDYDKDLTLEFKPISIEGKEYAVKDVLFDDSEDGKLVVTIGYDYENSDNIDVEDAEEIKAPEATEEIAEVEAGDVSEEAVDDGVDEVIESLKEAIRQKDLLEQEVKSLKAEKTVGDAEVTQLKEELDKYKMSFARVSELAAESKKFEAKVQILNEQLSEKDNKIKELESNKVNAVKLTESVTENAKKANVLAEKLVAKSKELVDSEKAMAAQKAKFEKALKEQAEIVRQSQAKLAETLNRYIGSKAEMLGVNPAEIKNRLGESYTLNDVDQVCENLLDYNVGMSRLPINVNRRNTITESKKTSHTSDLKNGYDIDDSLLELAGLK